MSVSISGASEVWQTPWLTPSTKKRSLEQRLAQQNGHLLPSGTSHPRCCCESWSKRMKNRWYSAATIGTVSSRPSTVWWEGPANRLPTLLAVPPMGRGKFCSSNEGTERTSVDITRRRGEWPRDCFKFAISFLLLFVCRPSTIAFPSPLDVLPLKNAMILL